MAALLTASTPLGARAEPVGTSTGVSTATAAPDVGTRLLNTGARMASAALGGDVQEVLDVLPAPSPALAATMAAMALTRWGRRSGVNAGGFNLVADLVFWAGAVALPVLYVMPLFGDEVSQPLELRRTIELDSRIYLLTYDKSSPLTGAFQREPSGLGLGYEAGVHAPGLKAPVQDLMYGLHNHLVAHGKAVDALRSVGGGVFNIGYVPTAQSFIPVNDSPEEVEAAKNAFFSYKPRHGHMWSMAMYTDPVFFGTYPEDFISQMGSHLPPNWEKDLPGIGGKTDFCGINLYSGFRVKKTETGIEPVPVPSGREQTAIKWYVEPETLRWAPRFLSERYGKPVIITENGLSLSDWVHVDGKVHDPARIDFTTRYLRELEKAIGDGANIAGYFHWSLMDNFEWAEGYRERFGLIHVDLQTQKRTIKDSGYWYKSVIESNGKILHD